MKYVFQLFIASALLMTACSKKTTPSETTANESKKPTEVYRPPVKTATPKSIAVNDAAAKKDVNGRYYYDLEGKRYWKSKKDGKYYLYYKGMFENKEFQ